jgi:hypothetical protein
MKFLKDWKLFLEADEVESENNTQQTEITQQGDILSKENDKANGEALKQIQTDLSYYKSKVQVMMDIFKDSSKLESDLNSQIQQKVYSNQKDAKKRNKYLVDLEGLYRMKRRVDRTNLDIIENTNRKEGVQQQMNDLKDRFNESEDASQKTKLSEQIEKSRNYLKQLSDTVTSKKKELTQLDKNYQEKRKKFETMMKTEENRIKDLSRK